jgi:ribonuclease D
MITTKKGLEEVVQKSLLCESVALDTEFVWEKTFYPILGLIQVGYPDGSVDLIDAVAIKDLTPLGRLLESPKTIKILHDALQDLMILNRETKGLPKAIFDTQKAAGFVGFSSSIALSELLKQLLSVYIKKAETKSDWVARPLSESQINYAEEDVSNGVALMHELMVRAGEKNRKEWVLSEMSYYDQERHYNLEDPILKPARVKRSGALNNAQKTILRSLSAWREAEAMKKNVARKFIISDEVLVSLAKSTPDSLELLKKKKSLSKRFLSVYAESFWKAIEQGLKNEIPPLKIEENFSGKDEGMEARVDLSLAFIKGLALDAKIDPALISNRAQITQFVYGASQGIESVESHRLFQDWRKVFCGQKLYDLLTGSGSLQICKEKKLPIFVSR